MGFGLSWWMRRVLRRALHAASALLPALAASALLSGCRWFDPDVHQHLINVSYLGTASDPVPTGVGVIAGDDKFWWPRIDAGQTRSVTLLVAKNPGTTLTLQFSLAGVEHSWESDQLDSATDHRIDLAIHPGGQVRSSHCMTRLISVWQIAQPFFCATVLSTSTAPARIDLQSYVILAFRAFPAYVLSY